MGVFGRLAVPSGKNDVVLVKRPDSLGLWRLLVADSRNDVLGQCDVAVWIAAAAKINCVLLLNQVIDPLKATNVRLPYCLDNVVRPPIMSGLR